ncbi:MAG: septum formation protein Maf [Bdellovibrionales bacterium]|nr:septum formation protein Maf [Bdellovibrionales bacterium]
MSKLILASGSPRRKELLEKAGLEFQIFVPDVDEAPLKGEIPKKMVGRLSRLKAAAALEQIQRSSGGSGTDDLWVIAADTTVVSNAGKNLGKPVDTAEAMKMLKALQGRVHRVFTGFSISHGKKIHTRVIETRVYMRKMSERDLARYIATGECMDKAGAYAAQGYGMILIEKIAGSYTNVVGLPIAEVLQDFKKLGFRD